MMKFILNKHFLAIIASVSGFSILAYIVLFSFFVPMIDEDFSLFAYGKSFGEVVSQCVRQYLQWNARIGDVLSILFSTVPTQVYNIINGLFVFGFLVLLIFTAKIIAQKNNLSIVSWVTMIILLFLALVYYLPMPNEVFFWRTGAANYFYPALFTIIYLVPFLRYILTSKTIKNPILATLYVGAGIVIGHSNENVAPVIFAFFCFWIIVKLIKEKQLSAVFIGSAISILTGVCLLLFGPSTQHRVEFYSKLNGNTSTFENIMANFGPVMFDYVPILLPSLVFSSLLIYTQKDNILRRKLWVVSLFAYGLSIASILILLCAPYYTPRAMFFSAVLLLIPVLVNLILIPKRTMPILFAFSLTLLIISAPVLADQLKQVRRLNIDKQNLISSIEQQLKTKSIVVFKPIVVDDSLLIYNGYPSQEAGRLPAYFKHPEASITLE